MGGVVGGYLARNHRDPHLTVARADAVKLLGELELDRLQPCWGEHVAALGGDEDARQHPQYAGARDLPTAKRLHAAAVKVHGERVLAGLGL